MTETRFLGLLTDATGRPHILARVTNDESGIRVELFDRAHARWVPDPHPGATLVAEMDGEATTLSRDQAVAMASSDLLDSIAST